MSNRISIVLFIFSILLFSNYSKCLSYYDDEIKDSNDKSGNFYDDEDSTANSNYDTLQCCCFANCKCECNSGDLVDIICDTNVQYFPKRHKQTICTNTVILFRLTNKENITEIPSNRFNGLNIESIELSDNNIENISVDVFNGISSLTLLDLSKNKIKNINEGVFKPVISTLNELNLRDNKLGLMSVTQLTTALQDLIKLKVFTLSNNSLSKMPNFSNNKNLFELNLKDNHLSTMDPPSGVSRLLPDSLKIIDLENNNLESIEANWFTNLKHIIDINLSKNMIATIDENAFKGLVSLKKLDLSKNYIKYISNNLFFDLRALEILRLRNLGNKTKNIGNYTFDKNAENVSFDVIDLSDTNIETIDPLAFCSCSESGVSIATLRVGFNLLTESHVCALYKIKNKAKIEFKIHIKCDCSVELLASKFDLIGDCLNEKNILVSMKYYKCKNETALSNMCFKSPICNCVRENAITMISEPSGKTTTTSSNENTTQDYLTTSSIENITPGFLTTTTTTNKQIEKTTNSNSTKSSTNTIKFCSLYLFLFMNIFLFIIFL